MADPGNPISPAGRSESIHGTIATTDRCTHQSVQAVPIGRDGAKNIGIFPYSSYANEKADELLTHPVCNSPTSRPIKNAGGTVMKRRSVLLARVQRERREDGPLLGLNNRQNKAIRFLGQYYPEPQSTSVIPGVSDITMEELIERKLVAEVSTPDGTERIFMLIALGQEEVRRLELREKSLRDDFGNRR
jgi:hypothetical protein